MLLLLPRHNRVPYVAEVASLPLPHLVHVRDRWDSVWHVQTQLCLGHIDGRDTAACTHADFAFVFASPQSLVGRSMHTA